MTERFITLYRLEKDLYAIDSPVIVAAGVLLKDTQTGNVIVQLKFRSISTISIKALKVGISAFDVTGQELESVDEYQYLDLDIQNGQEFGSNKAIVMPNAVSRSFLIKSIAAVLINGDVKTVSMPMAPLPKGVTLKEALKNAELIKQYILATNQNAMFVPQKHNDLWECSCGTWNSDSLCTECRVQKTTVFSAYDLSLLTSDMNLRLAEEEKQRREQERQAEQEKQEAEKQRAKRQAEKDAQKNLLTKRLKVASAIVALLIAIVLLYGLWLKPGIIDPKNNYRKAEQLFEEGKYHDAVIAFTALGDYKNAEEMLQEATYLMALNLAADGDLSAAISVLESINGYKDSGTKLKQIQYQYAGELLKQEHYNEAKSIYWRLNDYEDSQNMLYECDYLSANNMMSAGSYADAAKQYRALDGYLDSADLAIECDYLNAKGLIDNGEYQEAAEILLTIVDYKDSRDYISLLENVQSMVFYRSETSYSSEYTWIVSEIDTINCTSKLAIFRGNANGAKETIDFAKVLKQWKKENGKLYINRLGKTPAGEFDDYEVWVISENWVSITTKLYANTSETGDDYLKNTEDWSRLDDATAETIKNAFIHYFQSDGWRIEEYIAAQATLQ